MQVTCSSFGCGYVRRGTTALNCLYACLHAYSRGADCPFYKVINRTGYYGLRVRQLRTMLLINFAHSLAMCFVLLYLTRRYV